jgi:hypothetical protein
MIPDQGVSGASRFVTPPANYVSATLTHRNVAQWDGTSTKARRA